ncbi:hypothetical protein B835_573 [Enterococcus mundtii 3F]|nr:hypothetical protein [Enterococcus mundtii 3F]
MKNHLFYLIDYMLYYLTKRGKSNCFFIAFMKAIYFIK